MSTAKNAVGRKGVFTILIESQTHISCIQPWIHGDLCGYA